MNGINFSSLFRKRTGQDTTTLPVADILLYMNTEKDEIASKVKRVDEGYFGTEYKCDLEAGTRNYVLPATLLEKLQWISAKLDGTNEKTLYETEMPLGTGSLSNDYIKSNMAGREPGFKVFGGEVWILSDSDIINVTAGLVLYGYDYPDDAASADLASSDDLSQKFLPRALHKVWLDRCVSQYKTDNKIQLAKQDDAQYLDIRLKETIDTLLDLNNDRDFIPTAPQDDGQDY